MESADEGESRLLIFAFQTEVILSYPFHLLLIAVPLILQTFLVFFIGWKGSQLLKLPHEIAAPAGQ